MKQVFIVRHGQTEWNLARRMQGRLDSPLTEAGKAQAQAHGRLLKELGPIDEMHVSPSGRTRETAYILNSHVRARIQYQDALLERDLGTWSGLTVAELEAAFPEAWRARKHDPYHHRPPEGENLADMLARCDAFLERIVRSESANVVLVTHQVMSRVILKRLLGLTSDEAVRVIHPNDALYLLGLDAAAADACHYRSGAGPFAGLLRRGDDETIREQD